MVHILQKSFKKCVLKRAKCHYLHLRLLCSCHEATFIPQRFSNQPIFLDMLPADHSAFHQAATFKEPADKKPDLLSPAICLFFLCENVFRYQKLVGGSAQEISYFWLWRRSENFEWGVVSEILSRCKSTTLGLVWIWQPFFLPTALVLLSWGCGTFTPRMI